MFFKTEKQNPINMLKLKNGSEAPESAVETIMIYLELLMSKDPIALYSLVQEYKNPKKTRVVQSSLYEQIEGQLGLADYRQEKEIFKNIILSAVQGDGVLDMRLNSPVEKSNFNNRM